MHRWWKNVVKDYLTFTLKDKISLLCIFLVGLVIYFFPTITKPSRKVIDRSVFDKELGQLKISVDSGKSFRRFKNGDDDEHFTYSPSRNYDRAEQRPKGELFSFDPNTLDLAGWARLGVRERTAQTIRKFVDKGYKFRQPSDLKKIYGLRPEEAERLMPFVQIQQEEKPAAFANTAADIKGGPAPFTPRTAAVNRPPVDVNEADTTALIALPGIGSKLAARIISFRDKLGGFASINQVGETYGVPDSTFQKIKQRLVCDHPKLKMIDINKVDINALKTHPYLRWNLASAIVNYRQQHGLFKSIEDLKKIDIITDDVYARLAPYLIASN
jgi:competence protein ComEA